MTCQFLDPESTFRLENADQTSYLYFPLVNEAGMMSAITPTLHGDIKTDQNHFLTLPVSVEDLHNTRSPRDFWFFVEGHGPWSVAGNSARQIADRWTEHADQVTVEAGLLWHKVIRRGGRVPLQAEILNFVPAEGDTVELMQVTVTNTGAETLRLTPTAAIPLYGRSADNLRDHRHVTALLHRVRCHSHGVVLRPTMSFDERGHQPNDVSYAVLGTDEDGAPPLGFFPLTAGFIGEGGSLDWPQAIVRNLPPQHHAGDALEGYEALGGLRFAPFDLPPGAARTFTLVLAVFTEPQTPDALVARYAGPQNAATWLARTRRWWAARLENFAVRSADPDFDHWVRWVAVQPTLRRLFGNSFLPYHDYGRGGRGWRDLWQDVLAILLLEGDEVADDLQAFFAGVRLDGSNATIIGSRPGEFKADRNNIPRVWMDHGAWSLLTVRLYIDQSGDLDFLLREQAYFKDAFTHRARRVDPDWSPEDGTQQRDRDGNVLRGSLLEHLLVQHLTAWHHIGEHGLILLEGADWNDGLDMARDRGESVAFSAMYAWNLRQLADLVDELAAARTPTFDLLEEIVPLLQPLTDPAPSARQARLQAYFNAVSGAVSGRRVPVPAGELSAALRRMADELAGRIREQEWLAAEDGSGWFNGYYDDHGCRVEGRFLAGVRMTLTGQVFPLMGNVAADEQVDAALAAAGRHLWDAQVGGYRLNTNFGEVKLDGSTALTTSLGRAFGFAFGHKENGAMFSHMAVMFANALYRRARPRAGWRVLETIYRQSRDFPVSRMYPGIPEYFDARGRGLYPWLTGSASWYVLTLVQWVYGVRGERGDLRLAPQLLPEQFNRARVAEVVTRFAGRRLRVRYHNPRALPPDEYRVQTVRLNGQPVPHRDGLLPRAALLSLPADREHVLDVGLA